MTYVRVGCTDNVWTTCNGRGQDDRLGAQARSQVYIEDTAGRDMWKAQWDLETANGVECSSGRRKELNFTSKMRAALGGLSGLRQELFRASCDDPDTFWMSVSYYKTCMRCSFGYLVTWGSLAVAARGQGIMEGPKREVILLWRRSNMEWSKLFLCGNRLLRHDIQLAINFPVIFWLEWHGGVGQYSVTGSG